MQKKSKGERVDTRYKSSPTAIENWKQNCHNYSEAGVVLEMNDVSLILFLSLLMLFHSDYFK